MRNIIYISSFDPIDCVDIENIITFNKHDTKYFFILPFSKFASFEDRVKMIKLALNGLNINYEIDSFLNDRYHDSIDLIELFKKYHNSGVDNLYLAVYGIKPILIDENKLSKINHKLNLFDDNMNYSHDIRTLKSLKTDGQVIDYIICHNLYFMKIITRYISGHRLNHSISVAKTAYQIALKNNLIRPDEYFIAGLLHDIGKHVSVEESLNYMEKYFRSYLDLPSYSYHQFVGAFLAKQLFPNISIDVYKAILTHCTGAINMSPIQKVVYASDKIEPTRGYDSKLLIESCEKDFNTGFLEVLFENFQFLGLSAAKEETNNRLTEECAEFYLKNRKIRRDHTK